jgi:hypothetical protein
LLVQNFTFRAFLGFGNLPDIFIERGFGHNLNVDDPHDTGFIDFLEQLNTLLIDLDYLKPTMLLRSHDAPKRGRANAAMLQALDTRVLCSRSRPQPSSMKPP